ncbi:unnamed protein product [Polarella glacialis]|uniref:Rubisco LSMT substrate-binding domain-containing protein n=1 Tax=Polarella glacialis TaxID=89957 RepID=A0A813ESJ7_POLGL|nr:unnamed protein product [Polarella glacialis]
MDLACLSHVAVTEFADTGRGLGCTKDLENGDIFLEVPLKYCWTLERARSALVLCDAAGGSGFGLTDKQLLHLHLLIESSKGGTTPSATSHLAQLPNLEQVGLPLAWTEEERAELEGSEVHTHCANLDEELPEDFARLQEALEAAGASNLLTDHDIGYKEYLWARCIFWSRYMSLTVEGEEQPIFALVPGLDMCNHCPDAPAGLFKLDRERGVIVARASQDYCRGQQVFINYKEGSFNDQLLLSFGFVLPSPQLKSSEITFSLQVTSEQLAVHRQLLDNPAFLGSFGQAYEVIHVPDSRDFESERTAELIVKHRLTLSQPLPPALLGQTRIQHLPAAVLADPVRLAVIVAGAPSTVASEELRVLFLLEDLLGSKCGQLPSSEAEDAALLDADVSGLPQRRQCAVLLRHGERQVLQAAVRELQARQLQNLGVVLRAVADSGSGCSCERCQAAGTPRLHHLQATDAALEAAEVQVARLSQALTGRLDAEALMEVPALVHLWMVGRLGSPHRNRSLLSSEVQRGGGGGGGGGPASWPWKEEANDNTLFALYSEKMRLWGSWFAAQWAHCSAVRLSEFSCIGQEQVQIRNQNSWSIPTEEALQVLAAHQPLLEVGSGTGYWAKLLQKRGVDLVAFDTSKFEPAFNAQAKIEAGKELVREYYPSGVQPGGPEVVEKYPDRTLVLMWADYMGWGTYGLQCLQGFKGQHLILVGEWRTATFGDYAPGMSEHGQSFSLELQQFVEECFTLVQTVTLPNWPLALDKLMLWQRRSM